MVSNQKLFTVGNFDFRLQHLLVIGVLALSVSISMLIRSVPATYGLELFEFDPFFNLRATEYILDNGFYAYFDWIDQKSWHPFGRDVSETSQVMLHFSAALLYPIFNFGSSLYTFTILFPLVIGSLTGIVVFAFVRVISGTTAGLFAALIFAVSVPIFSRGLIGWFKSEPLGLFFAFIAMYLLISGIKFNHEKISLIKLITAGFFLALGVSAWGGNLSFIIITAAFFFILPFVKNEKNFIIWAAPAFSASLIIFSLMFEKSTTFIIGYAGIIILLPTLFVILSEIIKKFSSESKKLRNCFFLLISIIISGIGIFSSGLISFPSFRYLNAVNPFLTSQDALTDSVAEHMTTDMGVSFTFLSILIIFSLIGIWFLFSKKTINLKTDMRIFALIIGLICIYISSAFVRLELFASIGMIVLGSIGISILLTKILSQNNQKITKIIFPSIIILLFVIPVALPENSSWTNWSDFPPTILSGGASFSGYASIDWLSAMQWLKDNTPENSVIVSWWDYGYWITTLGERTTLADNATLIDWQIKKIAFSYITTPDNSWKILSSHHSEDVSKYLGDETILSFGGDLKEDFEKTFLEKYGKSCTQIFKLEAQNLGIDEESCNPVVKGMDADYVLIFIAGERFYIESSDTPLYTIEGGGDESKKAWFVKISNHETSQFVEIDNITPTPYFMNHSTLGQLTPFSIFKYVDPGTGRTFDDFQNGLVPIFVKDMKLMNPETDPYFLVYSSPSFYSEQPGEMTAVLIYKINHNYEV